MVPKHAHLPPPKLPEKSVFRRTLPEELVAFSSRQGRALFAEAMRDDTAHAYFPLSEQFVTQNEPMFCALGSLTMVMNALGVDPMRKWKDEPGPGWRWWTDEMFVPQSSCLPSIEDLRKDGLGLDALAMIAAAHGADVELRRASAIAVRDAPPESEASFREALVAASRTTEAFSVVNFSRSVLGQTGSGHFSPIGGYHRASDSVLVLDVARFKYPPAWVPLAMLWEATSAIDEDTGLPRGWLRLSAAEDEVGCRVGAATAEPSGCGGS